MKAKLVREPGEYKWSSYHEYIGVEELTDTDFFLNMLDNDREKSKRLFVEDLKKEGKLFVNLSAEKIRRTDDEAREIIKKEMAIQGIQNIDEISLEQRISFIKELKLKGISIRQISQVTGLSRGKLTGI
ncbi:MAG: hypothetical protein ACOX6S_10855 [Clostridia bacterium]